MATNHPAFGLLFGLMAMNHPAFVYYIIWLNGYESSCPCVLLFGLMATNHPAFGLSFGLMATNHPAFGWDTMQRPLPACSHQTLLARA